MQRSKGKLEIHNMSQIPLAMATSRMVKKWKSFPACLPLKTAKKGSIVEKFSLLSKSPNFEISIVDISTIDLFVEALVETKMRACRHSIGDFDLRTSLLDDLLKKSVFSMFCFACYLRIFRIMCFSCPKRRGTT